MGRIANIKQLYYETLGRITSSSTEWEKFLVFASGIYRYNFDAAVLIYAQRPDATMVADMLTWNHKIGRMINKGAKSIIVLDHKSGIQAKYLFDIKDTNGRIDTIPPMWTVSNDSSLVSRLNREHHISDTLVGHISIMAAEAVDTKMADYHEFLTEDTKGTFLELIPNDVMIGHFRETVYDSVCFMVGARCGCTIPSENDFAGISPFYSKDIVLHLGNATCDISKSIIDEFRLLDQEIRRENNDRKSGNSIRREGRDFAPGHSDFQQSRSGHETSGEIRSDGTKSSQGNIPDKIQQTADRRGTYADDAQSERGSISNVRNIIGTDANEESRTKSSGYLRGLPAPTDDQGRSRGDRASGHRLQKTIAEIAKDKESLNGSFLVPEIVQISVFDGLDNNLIEEDLGQAPKLQKSVIADDDKTTLEEVGKNIVTPVASNYRHDPNVQIGTGQKTKFRANIVAIKTLKLVETENRPASSDEQRIMSGYTGWGGMAQAFNPELGAWRKEYDELIGVLTPEEYESVRASTPNAHYTSFEIAQAMLNTLKRFGILRGNILEPAMGIGNFFSILPESMSQAKLYGVELDVISGRIARQLYPTAEIRVQGFEEVDFPDNFFDAAIGNVPFGDYKVHDTRYDRYNLNIHDYFFCKTLDKVRPGGIIAFITSKGTLDKENASFRRYISERAELI